MALDPTFDILEGKNISYDEESILKIVLNKPVISLNLGIKAPFLHDYYDNLPQPFMQGGLIFANLDAIFNISDVWDLQDVSLTSPSFQQIKDQRIFLDLTRGMKGGTEYFLWRNANNKVYVDETLLYRSFRRDISYTDRVVTTRIFENISDPIPKDFFRYIPQEPDLLYTVIGSTDPPTTFEDFAIQFISALAASYQGTWLFFALPDDDRVSFVESLVNNFSFVSIVRLISSPYPWLVVQVSNPANYDVEDILQFVSEENGEKEKVDLPVVRGFLNLKKICQLWKIPFSAPSVV